MTTEFINRIISIAALVISGFGSIYAYRSYMLQKKNEKPIIEFSWEPNKNRWSHYAIKNSGGPATIEDIKFDDSNFTIENYDALIKGKTLINGEKISFKILNINGYDPMNLEDGIIIRYRDGQQKIQTVSYTIKNRSTSKRFHDTLP